MKGVIVAGVLPGLLSSIYVERRTGMLHFERDSGSCGLRFVRGHVVFGAASEKRFHLGEVLVAQGLLSEEHLRQGTEIVLRQPKHLGEALLEMGVVDLDLLEDFLAIHAREILVDLFSWRDGRYAFEEQDPEMRLEPDFPLKMSTGELIMEAVRRVNDRDSVLFALGDLEWVLVPSTEPLVRFQRIDLTLSDAFLLARVDGTLTVQQVLEITPEEREEVEASILGLLCTGILDTAPPPPSAESAPASEASALRQEILDFHASLTERSDTEVLGVPPEASTSELKAAYFRLVRRFHPDTQHDPALADLRKELDVIFLRVKKAYETLGRSDRRQRHPPGGGSVKATAPTRVPAPTATPTANSSAAMHYQTAENILASAEERFGQGRFWEAVALAETTARLTSGRLRARARVLLARSYLQHPGTEKQAEKVLLEVTRESPENVDAFFELGGIYRRGGFPSRAAGMYSKVLELRPSHREAQAALAELESSPSEPPTPGGLLGKLLRRLRQS